MRQNIFANLFRKAEPKKLGLIEVQTIVDELNSENEPIPDNMSAFLRIIAKSTGVDYTAKNEVISLNNKYLEDKILIEQEEEVTTQDLQKQIDDLQKKIKEKEKAQKDAKDIATKNIGLVIEANDNLLKYAKVIKAEITKIEQPEAEIQATPETETQK